MNASRKRRRVLLLEPDYANKYPPIGLMKLATYHRQRGWDVVFFKGNFDLFVAERLALRMLDDLTAADDTIRWGRFFPEFRDFIRTGKSESVRTVQKEFQSSLFVAYSALSEYREKYRTGEYFTWKEWDRVLVTTLFTFYADITIKTIQFAKRLQPKRIMVGGVMASVVPEYIEKETGIHPFTGIIKESRIFDDKPSGPPVDDLPLDYSILEEIDYRYPAENAFFGHTTRGCPNKCAFCAVPVIEPEYQAWRPLAEKLRYETKMFGDRPDLLLMDNNVFASKRFSDIIDEILGCGFAPASRWTETDPLQLCKARIEDGYNEGAYLRKGVGIVQQLAETAKTEEDRKTVQGLLMSHFADRDWHGTTREDFLALVQEARPVWERNWKPRLSYRSVDFNQGLDSRISARKDVMHTLAKIPIRPVRIAFDHWELRKAYEKAIRSAAEAGLRHMSNYVLYNFRDYPEELYWRLRKTVALADELGVAIYSFPMKYHPIKDPEWFSNRNFLGEHWCRKYIRFVQIVLNSTLGKVGNGKAFFLKAFGENTAAFRELLLMPEHILRNRWDCELNGETTRWRDALHALDYEETILVREHFRNNDWRDEHAWSGEPRRVGELLRLYCPKSECVRKAPEETRRQAIESFTEQWKNISIDISEEDAISEDASARLWPYRL